MGCGELSKKFAIVCDNIMTEKAQSMKQSTPQQLIKYGDKSVNIKYDKEYKAKWTRFYIVLL